MAAAIKGFSHFGLGVSDLETSLRFYCDLLGLKLFGRYVQSDMESNQAGAAAFQNANYAGSRQFAMLHLGEAIEGRPAAFLVITDQPAGARHLPGFYGWGLHHFSMWVDDLDGMVERLTAAGVEFVAPPVDGDSWGWAMPKGQTIRTVVVKDPDGNAVQMDQIVS